MSTQPRSAMLEGSELEARYRSALRLLPASYPAVWEEEMVATFLDSLQTDDPDEAEYLAHCGRPSRAERASIVALALRLRLGGVEAPPRSRAWGDAVRLVALVGLLGHAVAATTHVVMELWVAGWIPGVPVPDGVGAIAGPAPAGAMAVAWSLTGLLWAAAYLTLVHGARRAARVLAVLALLPAVKAAMVTTAGVALADPSAAPLLLTTWSGALVSALVVVALAGFHRDAPGVPARPWRTAFLAGLAVATVATLAFTVQAVHGVLLLDWPGVWATALVVAGLLHLAGRATGRARSAPAWALALALLAAIVAGWRVVSLLDLALADAVGTHPALVALAVQALGLVAVGVPLAVLARRTLRELPSATLDRSLTGP